MGIKGWHKRALKLDCLHCLHTFNWHFSNSSATIDFEISNVCDQLSATPAAARDFLPDFWNADLQVFRMHCCEERDDNETGQAPHLCANIDLPLLLGRS